MEFTLSKKEHTEIPDQIFPINIFYIHYTGPHIVPLHWHEHLEWIIIAKGSFRVQVGSTFEDLQEGDLTFINKKQIHSAFPKSSDSELYAIVFNEALIRNTGLDNTENKYISPLLTNDVSIRTYFKADEPESDIIRECLMKLKNAYSEGPFGYELLVKASLLESIAYIFHKAEQTPLLNRNQDRGSIEPVLVHLSNHFHEPLSVKQAASMCCISPNYFCSLFKKATGKTLIEYMNMLRIQEAERLLRTHNYTVQQVAFAVGYTNLTYFGRVFKKLKNVSPSNYLKNN
ncbi:AraC family transcriptional regulator [Gracilibacillus sp. S3-1-1]|uniref:AraC family transcriptional regulator n=1 Tax=Gracilibacillus pellucidus TaxID=3095368 RepID=A0ACC6M636_9BACI|nr:AraC family transcriptional regulator [Gracilibacillus sp. S3-1-1]MDX8046267.1 AraC family transcriptional regulator [Gracilibacillus sp. S3-1-1]